MGRKDAHISGGKAESVVVDSSSWSCQNLMVPEVKSIENPNGLVSGSETEPAGS